MKRVGGVESREKAPRVSRVLLLMKCPIRALSTTDDESASQRVQKLAVFRSCNQSEESTLLVPKFEKFWPARANSFLLEEHALFVENDVYVCQPTTRMSFVPFRKSHIELDLVRPGIHPGRTSFRRSHVPSF